MKLDVVVPTYNRSVLLRRTISSLLAAPVPAGLDVCIVIVDNNSSDDTERAVRAMMSDSDRRIVYVKEANQGASYARNRGISAGTGEVIGFIDDDEEIHESWYSIVLQEFADPRTEFIGGPYLPNWAVPVPVWLPPSRYGVIGVTPTRERAYYGEDFPGIVVTGNAVIRRGVFTRIGVYNTKLGRTANTLLSDEDVDFHRRLLKAGLHGIYVPELKIYHHIPAGRLTQKYYRLHCFWGGVSQGVADRSFKLPVPYVFGIPRYKIGNALRRLVSFPRHVLNSRDPGLAFEDELSSWELIGFIYGRHFVRVEQYYGS